MATESQEPKNGMVKLERLSQKITEFRIRWSGAGLYSGEVETISVAILEALGCIISRNPS